MVIWRTSGSTGSIWRIDFRTCSEKEKKDLNNSSWNSSYLTCHQNQYLKISSLRFLSYDYWKKKLLKQTWNQKNDILNWNCNLNSWNGQTLKYFTSSKINIYQDCWPLHSKNTILGLNCAHTRPSALVPQNSLYTFDIKYLVIIFLFSSRHQYEHKWNLFGVCAQMRWWWRAAAAGCFTNLNVPSMYQLLALLRCSSCWSVVRMMWRFPCFLMSAFRKASGRWSWHGSNSKSRWTLILSDSVGSPG